MGSLIIKPSVTFGKSTVGGACLIAALWWTASHCPFDLVITSGSDGDHSGPTDPHKKGNAFDVRSNNLNMEDKNRVLHLVTSYLSDLTDELGEDARIVSTSGGLATSLFFGFLEDEGTPNEHYHWQVRKGKHVPVFDPPPLRRA